jgi:hypothetical protein
MKNNTCPVKTLPILSYTHMFQGDDGTDPVLQFSVFFHTGY